MEELWLFLCAYTLVEIFSALCFRFCYPAVMFFIGWVKRNLFCLQAFFFLAILWCSKYTYCIGCLTLFLKQSGFRRRLELFFALISKNSININISFVHVCWYLFILCIYLFIYSPADLLGSLWEVFRSQIMSNVQERAVPKADNPWRSTRVQS